MILRKIKLYLEERRRAPLQDLCNRFDLTPETLRPMLEHWISKNKAQRLDAAKDCGGCSKCGAGLTEIYLWLD